MPVSVELALSLVVIVVAAESFTNALEHLGGMSHAYPWQEFLERYESHFGHAAVLE